jgi:exodeoxyribonuclease VII large subunit
MAQRRQQIIAQLKAEGVFDLQRELVIPRFCQRIAVISAATAAGYGDFCRQLEENEYGLVFYPTLFPAVMQGEQVEQSVIAALNQINGHADDYDVVVIIRGGGSTSDMSGFDTLPLAENVANFPLPIITGIGHDRDECVLDMVSNTRVKTPTAAAAFLIAHLADTLQHLNDLQQRLSFMLTMFKTNFEHQLDQRYERICHALQQRLVQERHRLELAAQQVELLDPTLLLRRGYSITLFNGKVVRDPHQLKAGDQIETRVEKGVFRSRVE